MRNLIRCHFHYLINKMTLLILFIVVVIVLLGNIINITSLNNQENYMVNNEIYFYSSFMVIRILVIFVSIFIFTNSFLQKSDQYVYLICTANISRTRYYVTKTISVIVLLGIFLWFIFFCFILVGYLGYSKFIYQWKYSSGFINLFLLMIFFGNLGLIFGQLLNNIYVVIIPFSIMNIGTIINEDKNNSLYYIYNLIFPNLINETINYVYGIFHIIIIISLLYCINMVIYIFKDL